MTSEAYFLNTKNDRHQQFTQFPSGSSAVVVRMTQTTALLDVAKSLCKLANSV
ncbi:hypothetical protein ABIC60_003583 [Phyllobacterium ifriqiyense]